MKKRIVRLITIIITIFSLTLLSGCADSLNPGVDVSKLPPLAGHYYHTFEPDEVSGEPGHTEWVLIFNDGTGVYATPEIIDFVWDYNYMYFNKTKITHFQLDGATLTIEYDGAKQIFMRTYDNPEDEYLLNLINEKEKS